MPGGRQVGPRRRSQQQPSQRQRNHRSPQPRKEGGTTDARGGLGGRGCRHVKSLNMPHTRRSGQARRAATGRSSGQPQAAENRPRGHPPSGIRVVPPQAVQAPWEDEGPRHRQSPMRGSGQSWRLAGGAWRMRICVASGSTTLPIDRIACGCCSRQRVRPGWRHCVTASE
jgi:hypothetical protein